jgi:hypothetical protein
MSSNNRFERSRGSVFGEPRRGVDDWDKSASFDVGSTARRSTLSLEAVLDTGSALVYRIRYE